MDVDSNLFDLDRRLATLAASSSTVDDWMTRANRESARSLRSLVHEAWMPRRHGVVARFHEGSVSGHTAPAYQVLRAAYEFNDAVIAVSNRLLEKPYAVINDAVRQRLGLLMRPVMEGSVEIDLVCPIPGIDEAMELPSESPGQTVMPDIENAQSTSGQALQRVLSVLEHATSSPSRMEMSAHGDDIGADGWRKLARLAGRCIDADFTIDFWPRTEPTEWFSFAPSHAAALKTFIRERSLTATEVTYKGLWQTASAVRIWFDLQTDSDQRISGTVPAELTQESMNLLNQRVRAVIREETDPEKEAQVLKRTLVSLRPEPPVARGAQQNHAE